MAKPTLQTIYAFDATLDNTITFIWGGNQVQYNTLTIRNNLTNVVVYSNSEATMRLQHTIPAHSLTNGTLYSATITVTDYNNATSEASSSILFYCYSTPIWSINIINGQEVRNSTYDVTIAYIQNEGELLQSYRLLVVDASNTTVYDSRVRYDTSNMTITISGIQDNNEYYIYATGVTVNGMKLDTGRINFTANFITPDSYFTCSLENEYNSGYVYLASNIVSIEGWSDSPVTYINNKIADLTNNRVIFDKDFTIDGNFFVCLQGYGYAYNTTINYYTDGTNSIRLYLRNYDNTFDYYELYVTNGAINYVVQSPYINKLSGDTIRTLYIRRKNNLYNLEVG